MICRFSWGGACSAIFFLTSVLVQADIAWKSSVTNGLYNDPANWVGDAVPSNGVYGAFTVAGNYTVTFPSQGLEEISATCVSPSFNTASGGWVNFDTTGTWWRKGGSTNWIESYTTFRMGGDHTFNIEGVVKDLNRPQMLFSNALFRSFSCVSSTTNIFERGYFNFYEPTSGKFSGNTMIIGHDTRLCTNYVIVNPEAKVIFNGIGFRAKSAANYIQLAGGEMEVRGAFSMRSDGTGGAAKLAQVDLFSGLLTAYSTLSVSDADNCRATLNVYTNALLDKAGSSTFNVGNRGTGILNLYGGIITNRSDSNFQIGCNTAATGIVNHVAGELVSLRMFAIGQVSNAVGRYTLNDGKVTILNDSYVGNNGAKGTLDIYNGQFLTRSSLYAGNGAGSTAAITLYSGIFSNGNFFAANSLSSTARMDLLGGQFTCAGTMNLGSTTQAVATVLIQNGTHRIGNGWLANGKAGEALMIQSNGVLSVDSLHVGVYGKGALYLRGGIYTNNNNSRVGFYSGGNGTLIFDSPAVYSKNEIVAGAQQGATGTVAVVRGNNTFGGIRAGSSAEMNTGSIGGYGIVDILGGNNSFTENIVVGYGLSERSLMRIYGGTNTCSNTSGMTISTAQRKVNESSGYGTDQPGFGEFEMYGGQLALINYLRMGIGTQQIANTNLLRMAGGLLDISGVINVCDDRTAKGQILFTGGTIRVQAIRGWTGSQAKGGIGWAGLIANGGTLECRDISTSSVSGGVNDVLRYFDDAQLGAAGLTIDTCGQNRYFEQSFTDIPGETGRLVKTGSGDLIAKTNSNHSITEINGGSWTWGLAAAQAKTLVVSNGATLSLVGTCTSLTVQQLALHTAVLAMDTTDTLTVSTANGLTSSAFTLKVSDMLTPGTFPLMVCKGQLSNALLKQIRLSNGDASRYYRLQMNYVEATDTSTLTLTISTTPTALSTQEWLGSTSNWTTPGNWDTEMPGINHTALFSDRATLKTVDIAADSTVGAVRLTSNASYTFSGLGTLFVDLRLSAEAAALTRIVNPLALMGYTALFVNTNATVQVEGPITSGTISKTGKGQLILSGNNTYPSGITAAGGILTIASPASFGTPSATADNLALLADTFRYTGSATTLASGLTVAPGTGKAAVLDVQNNLALHGTYTTASGSVIKRGAGSLTLNLSAGSTTTLTRDNGQAGPNIAPTGRLDFASDGTAPTNGYGGLTIAEGLLRLKGPNTNTTVMVQNVFSVGAETIGTQCTANPELEIDGCFVNQKAGALHLQVGAKMNSASVTIEPAIRIINGAYLLVDTLKFGLNTSSKPLTSYLTLNDSRLEASYALIIPENSASTLKVIAGITNSTIQTVNFDIRSGLDMTINNSAVSIINSANPLRIDNYAKGSLRWMNGARLSASHIRFQNSNNDGTNPFTLIFDNAIFEPTGTSMSLVMKPLQQQLQLAAGGLTVYAKSGVRHTFACPLTGQGGFIKTGDGEVVFDIGRELISSTQTNINTSFVVGGYTGLTEIRQGVLSISNATLLTSANVAISNAAALNLSAGTVQLGTLSGQGTISNGTLSATYRCTVQGTNAVDYLTFANVAVQAMTVDFNREANNPIADQTKIAIAAYDVSTVPHVNLWKSKNAGVNKIASFSTENNVIYATIRYCGTTLMILR